MEEKRNNTSDSDPNTNVIITAVTSENHGCSHFSHGGTESQGRESQGRAVSGRGRAHTAVL